MKNIRILLLLFVLMITQSCGEEFFEDARTQTNLATDKWGSTIDLERIIAGAYYGISSYEGNRGLHGLQITHEAFLSDIGYLHTNGVTGDWEQDLYARKNNRNDMSIHSSMWSGAYQGVALCNEIIGWIETNGAFKDQYGPIWTNRILGEAYFLRAWIYFTLVRIHAPAYGAKNDASAIILNTKPSKEAFANPKRSTVLEVYTQIQADLKKATELLPETFRAGVDPAEYQDRANRDAARFLLNRVYFQMGDFAKAKEQCDAIINSNRYPLTEDPIEAWNKTGLATKGKEVIWQYVQYSTSQQQWKSSPAGIQLGFTSRGSNTINSGRLVSASDAFLNKVGWSPSTFNITAMPSGRPPSIIANANNFSIDSKDKRLSQLWKAIPAGYDPRPEYTAYTKTYVWCNKWNRLTTVNNNLFSLPFMRSAELYLTRSLILFRAGDKSGALNDLNIVRKRAGLDNIQIADFTEDMIHTERMRELAFEDDRLYYLQALKLPIPSGDRTEAALPWNTDKLAMPIPATETNINPNANN